jgi:hypothetical protein
MDLHPNPSNYMIRNLFNGRENTAAARSKGSQDKFLIRFADVSVAGYDLVVLEDESGLDKAVVGQQQDDKEELKGNVKLFHLHHLNRRR